MTTHDDALDAGAPVPNGAEPPEAAEQVAEGLLDGAAAVDAIGVGDVGEDAAEVVRRLTAQSVAQPADADAATGGVWVSLEAADHPGRADLPALSVRLDEPPRDRQSEPGAAAAAVRRAPLERLEDALPIVFRDPRPLVDHPDRDLVSLPPGLDQHRPALAVADRVLDQVGEGPLELVGVGIDHRQVGIDREAHRIRSRQPLSRRVQHLSEVDRLPVRLGLPRLDPRHVEQVLDQPGEPLALVDDRLTQLLPLLGGQRPRAEGRAAGDYRGQRRPQVVGDGAQQRGLQLVAATQRLRLDRFRLHAVALPGQGGQLRQGAVGLLPTPLGLHGPRSRESRNGAADNRRDHERGERNPVLLLGDREAM